MDLARITAILSISTALLTTGHAANQVVTVGPTGSSAQYTSLQEAIVFAGDGDILLVKPGSDSSAVLNGKGLTIVADDPTGLEFVKIASLTIQNVSPPSAVVLRGFRLADALMLSPRLQITNCSGVIAIEDCQVENGVPASIGIANSAAVTLSHCVSIGATGHSMAQRDGSSAVDVTNSNVALYDCALEGGRGGDDFNNNQLYAGMPTDGGAGIEIGNASSVLVCGSIVSGGDGGDKVFSLFDFNLCGDGGNSITLATGSTLRRLNSPLIPGAGGTSIWPQGIPGQDGVPLLDLGGTVIIKNEWARRFEASTPVREGETQTLTVHGQPGESCWLLFSLAPAASYFPGLQGTLLPALPITLLALPPLDGTGTLALPAPIPSGVLPPGVMGVSIYEQPMFVGGNASIVLGSPSVTVLLDDDL